MKYLELDEFDRAWIFRHKDLPLADDVKQAIKPYTEAVSNQLWHQYISQQAGHPSQFSQGDWTLLASARAEKGSWQDAWDSDDMSLPSTVLAALDWDDNTNVLFFYDGDRVVETTWRVFKQAWKNFLFFDDGPILLGKKRKQVVQFLQDGSFVLGNRPN